MENLEPCFIYVSNFFPPYNDNVHQTHCEFISFIHIRLGMYRLSVLRNSVSDYLYIILTSYLSVILQPMLIDWLICSYCLISDFVGSLRYLSCVDFAASH